MCHQELENTMYFEQALHSMGHEHVLVASVGPTDYDETTYVLDGVGRETTHLSPIALTRLLNVDTVLIARTEQGAQAYDDDIRALEGDGFDIELYDIPKIQSRGEIDEILDLFASAFSEREAVTVSLGITHAYRSLAMVFFSSLSYLDALDTIDIAGVYYGEYQKFASESPIIDLTHLYTLTEWYHALRSFERTGNLGDVARLLDEEKERLFRSGEQPEDFARITKKITGASRHLDSGLPLEGGIAAADAVQAMEDIDDDEFVGPEGTMFEPLRNAIEPLSLQQNVSKKTEVKLDIAELQREAGVIRFYYERGRYWLALECARELFINRVLYDSERENRENWLAGETRRAAKERINRMKEQIKSDATADLDTPDPIVLWDRLSQYRNYYAHSGFDADSDPPSEDKVRRAMETLCESIGDDTYWEVVQ